MPNSINAILENPSKEYINAMLSKLAYENLKRGRIESLSSMNFSNAEIDYLKNNFEVISSFSNNDTGFCGYFLKNTKTNEKIYAIAGTDSKSLDDLLTDSDIATKGMAIDQFINAYNCYQEMTHNMGDTIQKLVETNQAPQTGAYIKISNTVYGDTYYSLETVTNINAYGSKNNANNLTITGHSLGGHLAGLMSLFTGEEAYLYNAPGYHNISSDGTGFNLEFIDENDNDEYRLSLVLAISDLLKKNYGHSHITHIYNENGWDFATLGNNWPTTEINCLYEGTSAKTNHSINEICTSYYAYETIKDIVTAPKSFYQENSLTSFQETFENVYKAYCAYFKVNYQNLDYSNCNFINNLISAIAIWKDNVEAAGGKIIADSFNYSASLSINGGANDDVIYTGGGNDTVYAGAGDDIVYGYDYFNPEASSNYTKNIDLGGGNDQYYGGAGKDVVNSGSGSNIIHTGAGRDEVNTTAANEEDLNKVYLGAGGDTFEGGKGRDIVDGGVADSGEYDINEVRLGGGNDEYYGGAGIDKVHGGSGDDYISGGANADFLYGDGGNDIIANDNNVCEIKKSA